MKQTLTCLLVLSILVLGSLANADLKPINLDHTYEHDKWGTSPQDRVFNFAAFTVSFDGHDDNNGDGISDKWGIPEWVSYEIKKVSTEHSSSRPKEWATDPTLFNAGIAPNDATYHVAQDDLKKVVKGDYRFVRGHMCPKDTAERISSDAAWNTHTVLNAVPQLQWQNNGIWKKIEQKCHDWADKYDRIWVTCGPVFFKKSPAMWLGQSGEKQAAIPDALFKIIVREKDGNFTSIAFLIPNIVPKGKMEMKDYITTIENIQGFTGLDFLTKLDDTKEMQLESKLGKMSDW